MAASETPEEAEKRAARKAQLDKMVLAQKQARQKKIELEAEDRAKRAAAMPNSLLTAKAQAVAAASKPYNDFDVQVPKTNGELKIHVKHSHKRGLFIHGFKQGSLAEQQGILRKGDELLEVEEEDVHGAPLSVLVEILKAHNEPTVRAKFRRHKYKL